MTDPKRWRDGDGDAPGDVRRYLQSASRSRGLGPEAHARTAEHVARIASGAIGAASPGIWPKVLFAAATIGLAGLLLSTRIGSRRQPMSATVSAQPRSLTVEAEGVPAVPGPNAPVSPVVVVAPELPVAEAAADRPASQRLRLQRASRAAESPAATEDALARESNLLRPAHDALARDPRAALSLLRAHATEFPNGQLAQEREWIAFDALRRLGRNAEARQRGEAFIRRFPRSYNSERIRHAMAELP